ncbi:hypothetical protein PF005_g4024 [Phytophthora fragariae]|uniref:Uncharacterized protein n=1 Tax=Phytophthora fragariae TaxID=53985 RepID=A0A6A4ED98_9STRA|nr:hypothetical protein PF009_g4479 [Phytophthora fragariae]KAE9030948.1 hypothetical protein PF011_g354 [Phytophthora fragariae]KAE9131147.1 hypothetical protein PF010_g3590 [Phytophthora fragariae]KAE9131377.1 hypothetical protein PF007_g4159 [Phytophthora fragariae]KAE9142895.1 hypothetical protein PF006_g12032 [Phytophthora fragariae]
MSSAVRSSSRRLLAPYTSECPSVQTVVQFEDDVDEEETLLAQEHKIKLMTLCHLVTDGKQNVVPADPQLLGDMATICDTSGTTKERMGTMLTHTVMCVNKERLRFLIDAHYCTNMMAASTCDLDITLMLQEDIHLSYLTLTHCFKRVIPTTTGGGEFLLRRRQAAHGRPGRAAADGVFVEAAHAEWEFMVFSKAQ